MTAALLLKGHLDRCGEALRGARGETLLFANELVEVQRDEQRRRERTSSARCASSMPSRRPSPGSWRKVQGKQGELFFLVGPKPTWTAAVSGVTREAAGTTPPRGP
jgi:hypothetical protein